MTRIVLLDLLGGVALLLWGLISFAAKPLEAKPNDALPIDIISGKPKTAVLALEGLVR